jgi:hypothetical protein
MLGLEPVWEVLGGVAALWVLGALFAAANGGNFLLRSGIAEGIIVAAEDCGEDGYSEVVEFVHGGRRYRARGRYGGSRKRIHVGKRVRVRYRLDRPEVAKLDSPWQVFALALALAFVGALFASMAACVAVLDAHG